MYNFIKRLFIYLFCYFELSIHQTILRKKLPLLSTLIIISNVSWAANQYIRMISEGSCDTEDWSDDAENTALITEINYILTCITIEKNVF